MIVTLSDDFQYKKVLFLGQKNCHCACTSIFLIAHVFCQIFNAVFVYASSYRADGVDGPQEVEKN